MVKVEPMIRIAGVSKTFSVKDNKVEALKNVSLDIAKGDIYGIIGMSGAGKSTLVRCLNFLERPTEGTVYVEGQDLSTLDAKQLRQLRKHVAMIFQNFNLLMQRTVLDNVCFPMEIAGVDKKTAREKAREFLKVVELSDKEKAYPAQLSGGQKQRVAIARALAMNPTILLCDEATSALDPTTTKSILALLKDINEKYGITIVIITHSMEVVQEICTHVAIIDAGELAENDRIAEQVKKCEEKLELGESYYEALKETGMFSGFYIQMIKVGTRSGHLDSVMEEISNDYEEIADTAIDNMIARFEPTIVAVLAVSVGLVLLSVMLPLAGVLSAI